MHRRRFCTFLALACAAGPALAVMPLPPLEGWVAALYGREIKADRERAGPPDEEAWLSLFIPGLAAAVVAARDSPQSIVAEAAVPHPLFGRGHQPGQPVELVSVSPAEAEGDYSAVRVTLYIRQKNRDFTLLARPWGSGWQIADVHYDLGESFADFMHRIAGR